MGRATSGVTGMKFRDGDEVLSMSVIRAAQVAAEARQDEADGAPTESGSDGVKPQYVFTMTDGGFAKRSRITDYRLQSRGGIGIKTMSLTNEDRGGLVGAFIVVDGDEILSITQAGQVVRSPINADFRATGRDTMGVKFVTPKEGDAVAVVTRSVETPEVAPGVPAPVPTDATPDVSQAVAEGTAETVESPDVATDATIDGEAASPEATSESDTGPAVDPESEG
jgi:DNA gyrase subunit A